MNSILFSDEPSGLTLLMPELLPDGHKPPITFIFMEVVDYDSNRDFGLDRYLFDFNFVNGMQSRRFSRVFN